MAETQAPNVVILGRRALRELKCTGNKDEWLSTG